MKFAVASIISVVAASRLRAPAPAPASAPAPALAALTLEFEIANYNYLDLDRALAVAPQKRAKHSHHHKASLEKDVENWASNTEHTAARYVEAVVDDAALKSHAVADATHETTHQNTETVSTGVKDASDSANHHANQANDNTHKTVKAGADGTHNRVKITVDRVHGDVKHGTDTVKNAAKRGADAAHEAAAPAAAFGQLESEYGLRIEPLVRDVLRDTVRDTVEEIIEEYMPHIVAAAAPAGAAVASPAAALIALEASPAPAPAAAHTIDVFVQFKPGRTRILKDVVVRHDAEVADGVFFQKSYPNKYHFDDTQHPDNGKTVMVEVTITASGHASGAVGDELSTVEKIFTQAKKNGDFNLWLSAAMHDVSGLIPKLDMFSVAMSKLVQWSTPSCEVHMAHMVKEFVMAYTRRMVPTAIYNECTNYVPLMSFSHDYIPNDYDTHKCRDATIKFAKKWNFGKKDKKAAAANATAPAPAAAPAGAPAAAGAEFGDFCLDVCEAKYGDGAQQCHVTEGDELVLPSA